jgi:hypothetical protein
MSTADGFEILSHIKLVFVFSHAMSDLGDAAAVDVLTELQECFLRELRRGPKVEQWVCTGGVA